MFIEGGTFVPQRMFGLKPHSCIFISSEFNILELPRESLFAELNCFNAFS